MDPIDFIIDLQEQNKRSLAVLSPAFLRNFVDRHNFFITVQDNEEAPVGYLIHSRPRPEVAIHLNQICVAKHARQRGHGRRLLQLLTIRCEAYDVQAIITRCPAHLKAAAFFPHLGFIQTTHRRDRKTLTRYINHYSLAVPPNPRPEDAPRSRRSKWTGYPRTITVEALRRFHGLREDKPMEPL